MGIVEVLLGPSVRGWEVRGREISGRRVGAGEISGKLGVRSKWEGGGDGDEEISVRGVGRRYISERDVCCCKD